MHNKIGSVLSPHRFFVDSCNMRARNHRIEQKGVTFDRDFCFSFSFSLEGREKGKKITKVVVKSNAFLLDQS